MLVNEAEMVANSPALDLSEHHPIVYANSRLVINAPRCRLAACKVGWDTATQKWLPEIRDYSGQGSSLQPYIYDQYITYDVSDQDRFPSAIFDAGYLSYLLLNPHYQTFDLAAIDRKATTAKRYVTFLKFPNLLIDEDYGLVDPQNNQMHLHPVFPFCVVNVLHRELATKDIIGEKVRTNYLALLRQKISPRILDDNGFPNPKVVRPNSEILLAFANEMLSKHINISTLLLNVYLSLLQKETF